MPKVTNISALEAEKIQQLLPNECLISIYNYHDGPWKLQVGGERVLQVQFDDVRAKTIHKGKEYLPISVDQAHEILSFVKKWEGYDFLINCHAGIARSSGVALVLNILFGYTLKPDFFKLSCPNPFVVGTLLCEYYALKGHVYDNDWKFTF